MYRPHGATYQAGPCSTSTPTVSSALAPAQLPPNSLRSSPRRGQCSLIRCEGLQQPPRWQPPRWTKRGDKPSTPTGPIAPGAPVLMADAGTVPLSTGYSQPEPAAPSSNGAYASSNGSSPNGSSAHGSGPPSTRPASPAPAPLSRQSPTPSSDVLLEFRDVHKSFGSNKILRGVSLKIRRGEAVGIIGGSGTGKSTALRLMAGLLAPDKGEVLVRGRVRKGMLSDDPSNNQLKVGLVFQSGALFDSLTVERNVGFTLYEHSDLPDEHIKGLVAASLRRVGLPGVEQKMPAELSGGMRKRVALARAIIDDDTTPQAEQVILYDEPTAGLDPVASTVVEDLIRQLGTGKAADGQGIASYVVVTHQHSTIRRAVDRLIFLHEGLVVWEGTVEEFDSVEVPIVRQFASGSLAGPIVYV